MTPARALLAVPLAVAALATPERAHAAEECPAIATCATITVPLDHSGATPGTLPLAYARVPATGARTGTIVYLSGGPGQAGIPRTAELSDELRAARAHYELVFVDPRGTGGSGYRECAAETDAQITACGQELGAHFNTAETALDLEDLRRQLGVGRLALLGVSYGTLVAEEYARRFPERTERLILDSAVAPGGMDTLDVISVRGIPRMLRSYCTHDCRRAIGDPVAALARATRRLQRAPLGGPFVSRRTGRPNRVEVTEALLLGHIKNADFSPILRAELPAAIASLARGDAAPFIHAVDLWASPEDDSTFVDWRRLAAGYCVEGSVPWAPDAPISGREATLRAFLEPNPFEPFSRGAGIEDSIMPVCRRWPPTSPPAAGPTVTPDVPVLVLSGQDDLRTPPERARTVATKYPRASFVEVVGVGHSVLRSDLFNCGARAVRSFLSGGPVVPCAQQPGGRRPQRFPVARYRPANLGALRPSAVRGRAGRTLTAVYATLEAEWRDRDAENYWYLLKKPHRLPGLRRGYALVSLKSLELHSVETIPGVLVSGKLSNGNTGTLTVSGPAAARGTLTFRRGKVTGTLGGVRITAAAGRS